ncbi:hypothetical protein MMUR_57440 [Mycolicibacterium murale]|uniref:Uncharacterized protein n=1 Tax=Mycolicibacterium murale TaxID=182220 RepID=A0A7I9WW39_9MYCO|nr:hypothetical protein [Mycolicibacterium murale]MCV7181810.1 hypothetical protein [Mycolicibacterium murale]GFG61608.1 hypothetical protein MMUR_57440 [Mycolicibacterium murale]
MRGVLATLLWLLTTVALALALPAAWVQTHLVNEGGYARFAEDAASQPALQQAMAGELTTQILNLGPGLQPDLVAALTSSYTASAPFPQQFAEANRFAHRWMFTDAVGSQTDAEGRWVVDIGPMLNDTSIKDTLQNYNIEVPQSLPVPLTQNAPEALRPGRLQTVGTWAPWFTIGAVGLAAVFALLTLAAARSRGKALAALGVSALIVGAAGWAGLEIGRGRLDTALGDTSGDVRAIADALVDTAIGSMHHWLNLTLATGGGLVALGVLFAMLGGVFRRTVREPA